MSASPPPEEGATAALLDELTLQLTEQRASLEGINAALAVDPSEVSLLDIRAELEEGISHMEQALLELQGGSEQEGLEVHLEHERPDGLPTDKQQAQPSTSTFNAGDACRFRYMDGHWYRGVVVSVDDKFADVTFAVPTKPFQLQPVLGMPLALVEPTCCTTSQEWGLGACVLAKAPWHRLWASAEVTALDMPANTASVVFPPGGRTAQLPLDQMAASPYDEGQAEAVDAGTYGWGAGGAASEPSDVGSDDEGSMSADGDGSDLDSEEDEADGGSSGFARVAFGLRAAGAMEHARQAAEAGVQSSTVLFAQWESHTRGIASKLLAGMGFMQGQGLGKTGAGQVAPLEVTLLPLRRGLGGSMPNPSGGADGERKHKKRRRGGERSRRKKHKAEAAAAKQARHNAQHQLEVKTGEVGLFALLNNELGAGGEAAQKLEEAGFGPGGSSIFGSSGSGAAGSSGGGAAGAQQAANRAPPDRRGLLQQQDRLAAAQDKVQKLAAMLTRNKSNKSLAMQISQKLAMANADVERARSELASMSSAVTKGEAKKGMFKF